MSLSFPYKQIRSRGPVTPLGGRWVRPRPIVLATMVGPAGTHVQDALLDTGADDSAFPEAVAAKLGIDLRHAPAGEASGFGLTPAPVRYALVTLRLTDGREFRQWPAWVAFTPARLKQPLLGFAGCLQFFGAYFHGDREEVELTVNALYPGT